MFGSWEWLVILLIVLLLFGVGRISQVFAELGKGIRAFREGLQGEDEVKTSSEKISTDTSTDTPPSAQAP